LQQTTEEKLNFHVAALVGSIQAGLEGIHTSYMQVCEIESCEGLLCSDLVLYDDVKNAQVKYSYSFEMENKIINAICTGNEELAQKYVTQAIYLQMKESSSVDVYRCFLYDLLGTLIKAADFCGYRDLPNQFDFIQSGGNRVPVSDLDEKFGEMVKSICTYIQSMKNETESNQHLSNRIREYILENYSDPDLNISIIGLKFNITPTYLSSLYKKQTNENLLDFINKIRLQEAKKLLEQDYSVVEVAQMTGFRDSGSFIRVFKKKMGVTPGQYKVAFV
jgi:two-component system response regulator YesN